MRLSSSGEKKHNLGGDQSESRRDRSAEPIWFSSQEFESSGNGGSSWIVLVLPRTPRTASIDENASSVHRLAEVLGNPAGEKLLDANLLQQQTATKKAAKFAPKRVLFVVWTDPVDLHRKHTFYLRMRWRTRERHPLLNLRGLATDELEEMVRLQPNFWCRIRTFRSGSRTWKRWRSVRLGWRWSGETPKFAVNQRCRSTGRLATFFPQSTNSLANFIRKCSARKTKYQGVSAVRKTDATTHAQPASLQWRYSEPFFFA